MNYSLKVNAPESIEGNVTLGFHSELSADQLFCIIRSVRNRNYKIDLKKTDENTPLDLEDVLRLISGKMFHKKVVTYNYTKVTQCYLIADFESPIDLKYESNDTTYGTFFNIKLEHSVLIFSYKKLGELLLDGYKLCTTNPSSRPTGTELIHYITHNGNVVKLEFTTEANHYKLFSIEETPVFTTTEEIIEY